MSESKWIERKDLNWCYGCWFNAKIESKETLIGTVFICLNCGFRVRKPLEDLQSDLDKLIDDKELPKYFTDEEWDKYWEENFKEKDK
jgi:hypothetical protein